MKALVLGLLLALGFGMGIWPCSAAASRQQPLTWRLKEDRVDARIDGWPLDRFLEHLVRATGWKVYLEPDTEHTVGATFTNLPASEALRRLLGTINYALLPQTNGPAKFFVFRTSVQEATRLIQPLPLSLQVEGLAEKGRLDNELLVSLKPGSKTTIDKLARELGAKIIGRADSLNTYRLEFDDAAAADAARTALESSPDVAEVGNNYQMSPPTRTDSIPLSSGFPLNLKPAKTGDHVVVGLIDTAVQTQGSPANAFLLPAISVAGIAETPTAQPTHGTSMAETILRGLSQLSPGTAETPVKILPVDVYGDTPTTSTFEVAKGIAAAVQSGATVINLSLGGEGDSDFLHQVIQESHKQGVVFLAGAGNDASTQTYYPAAYPEVVAVTAGDRRGNLASYANHGSFVDVIAPGTSLVEFKDQTYLITGTSAATAYLSGVASGLASDKTKTAAQVEQQIRTTFSTKTPSP
ncbi:MAG TPA: S8 family serine peptidase [Candidatus Paceibacterota bacterium]|nr:S8 family serine peptidase [Verrucomicrobiota bacterium]HRY46801.1 S8 family serine peptidase [Candidatus Paceibacterota bacterium]HSA02034.1 S8 family serine peptidase [Candidatus Paceibacterota bacterium]